MLAETLALCSAANAAYSTVKKFAENGKEISDMAGALGKIMSAEEALKAQGASKQKSIWRKAFGKNNENIDEFFELEKLKTQQAQLKELFQLYGRSGLWGDYIAWQAKERVRKKFEAEEKERARMEILNGSILTLAVLAFTGVLYFLIKWAINNQGIFS